MAERLQRTQILLEPQQHRALVEIARQEGRSLSDVVREMIRRHLEQRQRAVDATAQRQLAALERIRRFRGEVLARRSGKPIELDVVEIIDQIRGERDEQVFGDLAEHRD